MSEIYLTTDWHLFKLKDDANMENLNATDFIKCDNYGKLFTKLISIPSDSLLIMMGDLAYRDKEAEYNPNILVQLYGNDIRNLPYIKMLIKGNNDKYDDEVYKNIGFDIVCTMAYFEDIFITHKPISVGNSEINIHGHLHMTGFDSVSVNHIQIPPVENNPEAPIYKLADVLRERGNQLTDAEYIKSFVGRGNIAKKSDYKENPIDLRDLFDDVVSHKSDISESSAISISMIQPYSESANDKIVMDNDDLMEEIESLMKTMSSVRYIEDIDGKTYRTIDTPEDLIHRGGVCWDFVLYQTAYLNNLECENIDVRNFYIIFNDKKIYPTHTFTVIEVKSDDEDRDDTKFIYIESAFSHLAGVYESTSLNAIINFVINGVIDKYKLDNIPVQAFEFDASDKKLFYATTLDFMHRVEKHGKRIAIKKDTTEVTHVNIESLNEASAARTVDITENVPVNEICPVYVILMHTNTEFSNVIKTFTRSEYSHSSIALDTSLRKMYTFNRNGFFIEDYKSEFFQDHEIPFSMYMVPLTKKEFNKLKSRIKWFEKNRKKFVYDTAGCVRAYFGIPNNPEDKYFCSRFVADVLNFGKGNSGKLVKEPSIVFPSDFINFSFTKFVYSGSFLSYDKREADKNVNIVLESIKSHHEMGFTMIDGKLYNTETLNDINRNKLIPKYPWIKHMDMNDSNIIIKSDTDDLIGAASVDKKVSDDGLKYITMIHVSEKFRNKGFGKKLLNICVTKFKADALTVRKSDTTAIRLYEKFGFRKFKETDNQYFMKIDTKRVLHLVEDAEEILYIPEAFTSQSPSQFKIILNDDGSIRLTDREINDLNAAYKSSLKMIRVYNKSNNVQGLKDEACKIYYMIQIIDKYYLVNRDNQKVKSMVDLRASLYSTLTQTLKDIAKHDDKFDFYSYYSGTKYSSDIRIPKTHIQALFKSIITLIKL